MNTTPTPRTDAQAGWAIANQYGQSTGSELLGDPNGVFVHAVFARGLERELAALTAERDHWQEIAKAASAEREHNANVAQEMTAERDHLRDHLHALTLICGANDANKFETWIDRANARAERAEAEVKRLRAGVEECLRTNAHLADGEDCTLIGLKHCLHDPAAAQRAEAIAGKLQELHGCSQEMVVHWCEHAANRSLGLDQARSELTAEREKSERYRLATLKLDAELAAERARLDSGTILLIVAGERVWHCGVDLRAAIDAALKEGAK